MKRLLLVLAVGIGVAGLADYVVFRLGTSTSRALLRSETPELAWLQREFHLGEAELRNVSRLHANYLPVSQEEFRRIGELNETLTARLAEAAEVTPEIAALIEERARLRAVCQKEMLKYLFAVSRQMSPADAKRYLAWELEHTCLWEHDRAGAAPVALQLRH
jgi:hypothetical protein